MHPCSGSTFVITLTGAAQLVASAPATGRHVLFLVGQSTSSRIDMGFDNMVTAGAGIPLFAGGGGYEMAEPSVPQNGIYLIGTPGQTIYCAQG
jgi:hypothetical protein